MSQGRAGQGDRRPGGRGGLIVVTALSLVAVSACESRGGPYHTRANDAVVLLGTLGGSQSEAAAMNNTAEVVGRSSTRQPDQSHAFLWRGGRMIDLGSLGGRDSWAVAINDAGQVVGTSATASGTYHAFLWTGGHMTDLGTLPGQHDSQATGINADGQVIGTSGSRAFLWYRGRMTDLGVLPGGEDSEATAINDHGQVVGVGSSARSEERAFEWQRGKLRELPGPVPADAETRAAEINDSGTVIGDLDGRATVWVNGQASPLPSIGGRCCQLAGINASGQIAGSSGTRSGRKHAVLWSGAAATPTDLGKPPDLASTTAAALNDHGDVVGYATSTPNGITDARPVFWPHGQHRHIFLPMIPDASRCVPSVIDDHVRIAGYCLLQGTREVAVLWRRPHS